MARRRHRTVFAACCRRPSTDPLNSRHSIFTPGPGASLPRSVPTRVRPPAFTLIPITVSTLPDQVDHEPASYPNPPIAGWRGKHERGQEAAYFSEQQSVEYVVRTSLDTRRMTAWNCGTETWATHRVGTVNSQWPGFVARRGKAGNEVMGHSRQTSEPAAAAAWWLIVLWLMQYDRKSCELLTSAPADLAYCTIFR